MPIFTWACCNCSPVTCREIPQKYCTHINNNKDVKNDNMDEMDVGIVKNLDVFEAKTNEKLLFPEHKIDGDHADLFIRNLYKIYKDKKLCDVSIVVGDREIEAHRVVLAANSDYFYTMFTADLLESTSTKVVLKEVDFEAVKLLINYCYTSVIDLNTASVENLLKTAHLLQFKSIVKSCCSYMMAQLHPSNCLGISSFADLHGCTALRDSALTFATKHFREVSKTEEFYLASLDQICQLLSSDHLNVPSEKDTFDIAMSWVKHDLEGRRDFLAQILSHVRLELLPPKVLGKKV